MKYEHRIYSKGFGIKVSDPKRGHEVMNYLITGYPLAGKSLEGVTWEYLDDSHPIMVRARKKQENMYGMIKTMEQDEPTK